MALASDLVGTGVPPQTALTAGHQAVSIAAAGTTQGGATLITGSVCQFSATGADGVVLNSASPLAKAHYINCISGGGIVYCPLGHTMNGTSNGSVSIASAASVIVWQYASKKWASK
jgi:hypothetical protein